MNTRCCPRQEHLKQVVRRPRANIKHLPGLLTAEVSYVVDTEDIRAMPTARRAYFVLTWSGDHVRHVVGRPHANTFKKVPQKWHLSTYFL